MYEVSPAAYIFTHTYLNTMQQGIQSLHVVGELFAKTNGLPRLSSLVYEWAIEHKVVYILNAGGGEGFDIAMSDTERFTSEFFIPYATFTEPDFHNMITAFGFIMTPELALEINEAQSFHLTQRGAEMFEEMGTSSDEKPHPFADFLSRFPSAK